jgi:hypothetical protein
MPSVCRSRSLVRFAGALFLLGCAGTGLAQSAWEWRNPMPQGNTLMSVVFGNGMFVATGQGGTVLTSALGSPWMVRYAGPSMSALTFGNGEFVAVGGNAVRISPDAASWREVRLDTTVALCSVAYGDSLFVAVGYVRGITDRGVILTSEDGLTWTRATLLGSFITLSSVTFGGGRFAAVGSRGTILTSSDGAAWTAQNSQTTDNLPCAAWVKDRFIAMGSNGVMVTSPDGETWTAGTMGTGGVTSMAYGNGRIVAVGTGGTITTSSDGAVWTSQSVGANDLYSVAYSGYVFVAVGGTGAILTSYDGLTWTSRTAVFFGITGALSSVIYANGTFIALEQGAGTAGINILYSTNPAAWIVCNTGGGLTGLASIAYGNGLFLGVGMGSPVVTSADGITWTKGGQSPNAQFVAYGNGRFVATGVAGMIKTSADGTNWTARNSGTTDWLVSVAYGQGRFAALGFGGTIVSSSDGETWATARSGGSSGFKSIAYGNGLFVAVGIQDTILTSADGAAWSSHSMGASHWLQSVVFGNGRFVAVGSGTYASVDGASWTPCVTNYSGSLTSVAYGDSQFVAVGDKGVILSSRADDVGVIRTGSHKAPGGGARVIHANGRISIFLSDAAVAGRLTTTVFTPAGRKVFCSAVRSFNGTLNLPAVGLAAGVYHVSVSDGTKNLASSTFVVTR